MMFNKSSFANEVRQLGMQCDIADDHVCVLVPVKANHALLTFIIERVYNEKEATTFVTKWANK